MIEYRAEFTHIIGIPDPFAKMHGATFFRGYWKTVCGRRLDEACVVKIGTVDDGLKPSCRKCRKALGHD